MGGAGPDRLHDSKVRGDRIYALVSARARSEGIRVNCVTPGWVMTNQRMTWATPERVVRAQERQSLKRKFCLKTWPQWYCSWPRAVRECARGRTSSSTLGSFEPTICRRDGGSDRTHRIRELGDDEGRLRLRRAACRLSDLPVGAMTWQQGQLSLAIDRT